MIEDHTEDSTKIIKELDLNLNSELNTVKNKQSHIEKTSKTFETSIKNLEKNKIDTEELSKKNTVLEESFSDIKTNFEESKINTEELSKKNTVLEESFSEIKNNVQNIQVENDKIVSNVYNELRNKSSGGNINEVRFLSKIKNTNFINIENDKININKIDTHVCTIKINLTANNTLNVKEKIKYNYSKILNVSANIYAKDNNNILYIINPTNIKIIDGNCILEDNNIKTEDNQILCIYLHIICDKYSFNP